MAEPKPAPAATDSNVPLQSVVMTPSQMSRVRGVVEMFVGAGLVLFVTWPIKWMLVRRA